MAGVWVGDCLLRYDDNSYDFGSACLCQVCSQQLPFITLFNLYNSSRK